MTTPAAGEPVASEPVASQPAAGGLLADLLRAPVTAITWRYAAHVLAGVLADAVAFVFVVPVLVLGLVLGPLGVLGMPAQWAVVRLARVVGALDRRRLRAFTGVDVPARPRPAKAPLERGRYGWPASPVWWRDVGYVVLRLPVAAVEAALVWGSLVWAVGFPVLGLSDVGEPLANVVLVVLGVALLFLAPQLARAAVWVDVALARALLGPSEAERLSAEVDTLRTSRAGVVDAADAERRRIERDLHDGAQQRLVALAMELGVARSRYDDDPEVVRGVIVRAHEEAKAALGELRELVRGIHPAVLEDRGLDAALSALAARCAPPAELRVDLAERPHRPAEAAAYFVVAETLTNVTRHARASRVQVDVTTDGGLLRAVVEDDGVGGADTAAGTGLAGLRSRVAALDGTFAVHSPPGGPTRIVAELPCAS